MSETTEPAWRDLFASHLRISLVVLLTGVLLSAMNALMVSTVMPSAVRDIGGLEYMSWPVTAYLATSVISASAGGVTRALTGARNGYALAALVFGLGSLVAGLAPDIGWLVAGRAVQGIGGGLLSSLAYVMIRNVFPQGLWTRVFALFASVWGVAVLIGPLVGGVFAGVGFWRGSFLLVAVIGVALTLLALSVLPRDVDRPSVPAFPLIRLLLVGLGIVALSLAAPAKDLAEQIVFIGTSLAIFTSVVVFDRRAATRLLPSDAFSVSTSLGLGIWVLFMVSLANDPFPIYGPMFLQTLRHMSPLTAGYLVAMEALSWTLVANVVASLPRRFESYAIVVGPFAMGLGLIGISLLTESAPLWQLLIAIFLAGGGIGAAFTVVSQLIMGAAREGEGDSAASSVAAVQLVALAIGAALAGLASNVTGFAQGLSVETAAAASAWVPGVFAVATGIGGLAGIRLLVAASR